MPSISGKVVPILTVTDLERSAAWYSELLGLTVYRNPGPDGRVGDISMVHPASGLQLCLVGHTDTGADVFDETRTGLDHLEFLVSTRDDLDDWAGRLSELGIPHSGVKGPEFTANAMITFRDPDNIQLEFFWYAPHETPKS